MLLRKAITFVLFAIVGTGSNSSKTTGTRTKKKKKRIADRLVAQLDDDSYSVRTGAGQRLQWLAGSRQLAPAILLF